MTPSPLAHKPTTGTWIRWLILPLLLVTATVTLISKTEKQEMEIAVAVTFDNLAEDLLLIDAARQSVRLMVAGTASALEALNPQSASCRMDLFGIAEGTHTIAVNVSEFTLPKGVSLKTLLTPSLTIRLETVALKTVEVLAVLAGKPAPGSAVVAVKLKPDRIVLRGPVTMLAGIDTVKTRPINLETASESFKKEVPLNLPEDIAVEPPLRIVVADIVVKERIITRVLENIPVKGKGTTAGHQIQPGAITLTVSGPESIINAIESDPAFAVSVDLNGLTPGDHTLTAAINLPVQTTLVQVSPERFSVTIRK